MKVNFIASWRPDIAGIYKGVDAQKVAEEIYSLGEKVRAEEILEMAKNKNTEIHKLIEWDDTVAAEKYRLVQVRKIVRDIEITTIKTKNNKKKTIEVPVRMFYSFKDETGYRPTPVIIENEELHKKLLRTAYSELVSYMTKYQTLSELEPLMDEIKRYIYELKIFDEVA